MANVRATSFQKKGKSRSDGVPGTKPSLQNAQLLTSSGIPSFDAIVGGGIPIGSLVLIEEDVYGAISKVFLRYFLSEGILSKHALFVGSLDLDPKKLVSDLPGPAAPVSEEIAGSAKDNAILDIAWRYQNLDVQSSALNLSQYIGHHFDLTTTINSNIITNSDISYWCEDGCGGGDAEDNFENSHYGFLLKSIHEKLKSGKFYASETVTHKNVLRIGLLGVGSPLWPDKYLHKFLYCLRALLRNSFATCFVTVPTHLHQDRSFDWKCIHLSDICIRLESFTGTPLEQNPALRDYHGFFNVLKLAAINTLVAHIPPTSDLAFKLRRRKLVIEKLHLPPELEDSTEREQDEGPSLSCSSGTANKLDF